MNRALGDIPVTVKLRTGVKEGKNTAHKTMPRLAAEWGAAALSVRPRHCSNWDLLIYIHLSCMVGRDSKGIANWRIGAISSNVWRQSAQEKLRKTVSIQISCALERQSYGSGSLSRPYIWWWRLLFVSGLLGEDGAERGGWYYDRKRSSHQALDLHRNQGTSRVGYQLARTPRAH